MHTNSLFKGVVWPRQKKGDGTKPYYRYAIVGVLVSDQPIEALEEKTEVVLEGNGVSLVETIISMQQREPNLKTGDATNVLLSLDLL